jgi:hypothetical protein
MPSQNEILEAAVNELRKRRDQLDRAIEALEAELGISTVAQTATQTVPDAKPFAARGNEAHDLLKMVYEGQFYGKSQTQAAKDLLNLVRRPVKTPIIGEALKKSGMKVHAPSLYTAFKRSPEFVLVLPNTWGLAEWYPEGVRNSKVEKKPKRRDRKRKAIKPEKRGEGKSTETKDAH